jgi:accessory gene regulator protein AgrB
MKKLTYEAQLTISFFVVILGCILSDVFDFWIYHSIAYVIGGLLFVVHPVVPKYLEGNEKAVLWARIAGVILILIGILTRVHF